MKKVIIITMILLLMPGGIFAAGIDWGKSKEFISGGMRYRVVVTRPMSPTAARTVVKTVTKGVAAGGAARMTHPLVGVILTAVGVMSLVYDFDDIVEDILSDPSIYDPFARTSGLVYDGHSYYVQLARPETANYYNGIHSIKAQLQPYSVSKLALTIINFTGKTGTVSTLNGYYDGKLQTFLVYCDNNYDITWYPPVGQPQTPLTPTETQVIDEDALDDLIAEIDEATLSEVGRDIIDSSEVPSGSLEGEEIEPTLIMLGDEDGDEYTDPYTGSLTETETTMGVDSDPLVNPGQPAVPTLDPTIESPEKKDISELITGWLQNAPFMSIITAFDVQATSGQSVFTIPLPEVLGGTGTIDFGQFADLWAAMGAIIIGIAYIYGAMIIFGGKS